MIRIRVNELRPGDVTAGSGETVGAVYHMKENGKSLVFMFTERQTEPIIIMRRATWWSADHINVTREGANG